MSDTPDDDLTRPRSDAPPAGPDRQARVLGLRIQGATVGQVAAALHMSKSQVYADSRLGLDTLARGPEEREVLRHITADQLTSLFRASYSVAVARPRTMTEEQLADLLPRDRVAWEAVQVDDARTRLQAQTVAVKTLDSFKKLMGLDAPQRVAITTDTQSALGTMLDDVITMLEADAIEVPAIDAT